MTSEMIGVRAAKVTDLRRHTRPQALVELFRAVRGVQTGEAVEVLSGDPGLSYEIGRWAQEMGHSVLAVVEEPGYSRILVERGQSSRGIDTVLGRRAAS